jgi:SulP family sulfate permease
MELVAQGTANVFSSLFGGIPATGAIARTATNVKNGGRTPIAGITHAIMLLGIMLLVAPYAKLIPMACLAGILTVVAWHMGEWPHFFAMFKSNRNDVIIMVTTFVLTVVFDLIIAIEVGIVLAAFMFMNRMSDALAIQTAGAANVDPSPASEAMFEDEIREIPNGVVLYEINGPLFFGASQKFQETLLDLHQLPTILILRMRYVPFIDATGVQRLKVIATQLKAKGTTIVLSGVAPDVKRELFNAGLYDIIDKHNIFDNMSDALERARQILKQSAHSDGAGLIGS